MKNILNKIKIINQEKRMWDPENRSSKRKKAKRIPWIMMNSNHKKTALKPAKKGTTPIKVKGSFKDSIPKRKEKKKT